MVGCLTGGRRRWTDDQTGFLVGFQFDEGGKAVVSEGGVTGGRSEVAW